jgi:hypothetical protein
MYEQQIILLIAQKTYPHTECIWCTPDLAPNAMKEPSIGRAHDGHGNTDRVTDLAGLHLVSGFDVPVAGTVNVCFAFLAVVLLFCGLYLDACGPVANIKVQPEKRAAWRTF